MAALIATRTINFLGSERVKPIEIHRRMKVQYVNVTVTPVSVRMD
jgi:hypothetical protein